MTMSSESDVAAFVALSKDMIDAEGLREVRHYLNHGEHEMAFEGLVLELIKSDGTPRKFDGAAWLRLAEQLGLREESVWVGDFWTQLTTWVEGRDARCRVDGGE